MQEEQCGLTRDQRLETARALQAAIERGDVEQERLLTDRLSEDRYRAIRSELSNLTQEIQRVLGRARVADHMSRLARHELPQAHTRLQQVLEMTEEAANQTLQAVEDALPVSVRVGQAATQLLDRWPSGRSMRRDFKLEIRDVLRRLIEDASLLRARLSDVLVAQGYQDLTGQIIHPVIRLVAELENQLAGADDGGPEPSRITERDDRAGNGPAIRGFEPADSVSGQDDVDDLLSQFGV